MPKFSGKNIGLSISKKYNKVKFLTLIKLYIFWLANTS